MKLSTIFFIVLTLATFRSQAQVQFEMSVSAKEIGRKDEVQVEYVIAGAEKISGFRLPYFDKWTVVSGPNTSTQVYNMNGVRSGTYKYTYVLSPKSAGKLNLPGTTVVADGKQLRCRNIIVNVKKQDHVDGAIAAPAFSAPQPDLPLDGAEDFKEYDLKPGEDPIRKIRNNLFLRAVPTKTKCYVGEPVMVTYKLYTRLRSNSRVVKQPAFSGCSVSEMTISDVRATVETINGKKYNSYIFRRVQLFPLQAGRITAGIASVDNSVKFISGGSDLRKLYYGLDAGEEYNLTLSTEPFTIEVLPLPGKISTTVGNFEIATRLKKDTIAANETNALIVAITGTGNFKSVAEPEIDWPGNIYHFDATETDELDKLSFPLAGKKIYEIPFEVNSEGKIDIPAVSMSYFDPAKRAYQTTKSLPLQLMVTPAIKTNIQQSVLKGNNGTNINYLLYLLPVIFVVGAVIIWKMPKRKVQATIDLSAAESAPVTTPVYDTAAKMEALVLVQDDTAFYNKARELAKDLIALNRGDHDLLLEVLQDCNTQLYTPIPSTSRKEILDKLNRALA